MIFFEREKRLEILGNSRPGGNGGGNHDGGYSMADGGHAGIMGSDSLVRADGVNDSGAMAAPRRVKICPVCGVNPLPRGKSSCSVRCRKRKERILRKAREESLLYQDDQ